MAYSPIIPPAENREPARFDTVEYGDNWKTASAKVNANFVELYASIASMVPVVGTVGTLAEVVGEGEPVDNDYASLTVNPTGDDNSLSYTSKLAGVDGNQITVTYVDPGDAEVPLSVAVNNGTDIVVTLETDVSEAIVTTAAEIKALIEGDETADALVTVEVDAADSGSGDDGSGVVTAMVVDDLAGGVDGTGRGVAGPGSRYTDIETPTLYINTGTADAPTWVALAEA